MTEDRSLDEFAGGGDDAGTDDDAVNGGDNAAAGDDAVDGGDNADAGTDTTAVTDADSGDATDAVDPKTVDPATSTSTWTSGGAACADCGAVVERRWNADGDLVCQDCKSW